MSTVLYVDRVMSRPLDADVRQIRSFGECACQRWCRRDV